MTQFITAGIIGVSVGAQYALLALGFTLIFGVLGVINFAHGGFYVLGGYFAFAAVTHLGLPYPVAVLVAVAATFVIGYLFELLLVDRIIDDHLATMMLTLGLYLMITTGVHVSFGAESPPFSFPLSGVINIGGIFLPLENLVVLAICLVAVTLIYIFMYRTGYGRSLRALADDRAVATAQGIRPRLLFPFAFGLATAIAGLTGAVVTPILTLSPHLGDSVLTTAFLVVILGGLGSIAGATIAAFVVGLVEAYSSIYLGGSKGALALFVLILIILVVRPRGLLGHEVRSA